MKKISNVNELEKAIQPCLIDMVDKMAERVYETLNFFLQQYYDSYTPSSYKRQYDFLRSVVKVNAKVVRNKVVAYVYINTDSMNNYRKISGEQVVTWANEGLHGGLDVGNNTPHVWDDTLDEMIGNGKLLDEAIDYLRKQGFEVRKI